MTTIHLKKESIGYGEFIYIPIIGMDLILMQHCMNEDLIYINSIGLDKVKDIVETHGWSVVIV